MLAPIGIGKQAAVLEYQLLPTGPDFHIGKSGILDKSLVNRRAFRIGNGVEIAVFGCVPVDGSRHVLKLQENRRLPEFAGTISQPGAQIERRGGIGIVVRQVGTLQAQP